MTYIQEVKLKKMTPSEHSKVTPLEVAYVDVHEDAPKLNAEYIVLLKLKRLGRVRHSRCKA